MQSSNGTGESSSTSENTQDEILVALEVLICDPQKCLQVWIFQEGEAAKMFEKDENNNIYSFRVTDPNKKAICVDIYKFFSNGRKSCKIRLVATLHFTPGRKK